MQQEMLAQLPQNQTFVVDPSWLQTSTQETLDQQNMATLQSSVNQQNGVIQQFTVNQPDPGSQQNPESPLIRHAPHASTCADTGRTASDSITETQLSATPSWTGLQEEGESEDECVKGPSYKEKIRLVGEILNKKVAIVPKKGSNISMVLEDNSEESVTLPPSEGFPQAFEKWHGELTGAPGSRRATSRPNEILELYAFPQKPRNTMKAYNISDRPWQQTAPPANKSLTESSLYRGKEEPFVKLHPNKLRHIESSMRECISILSHLDWFLAASKTEIKKQAEELNCRDFCDMETLSSELSDFSAGERLGVVNWAQQVKDKTFDADLAIWNSLHNVVGLIESAGRCAQDTATAVIDAVGCCTLARRDSWLDKFPDLLPKDSLLALRGQDVNQDKLFSEESLRLAREQVEAKKSAKVQDKFLEEKKDRPRTDNRPRAQNNNNNRRFQRFRPLDSNSSNNNGGSSNNNNNNNPTSNYKGNNKWKKRFYKK
jgi:hypothetical protein